MKKTIIISILLIFSLALAAPQASAAETIQERLSGMILLQVEEKGEAWYVYPDNLERYFLGYPKDAFEIMRNLGLGISNADFDSYHGYAPARLSGKILLKVEDMGKAYYVYPNDLKMYYLGYPKDAFEIMRSLGLGINNADLEKIPIAIESPRPTYRDRGVVLEVVDGNTIILADDRMVDLAGISDPAEVKMYEEESKAKLSELVLNKTVELEKDPEGDDIKGILSRYVFVDNVFVNLELVKQGYVVPLPIGISKYMDAYEVAIMDAIYSHRGLWGYQNGVDISIDQFHYNAEGNDNENLNDEYVIFRNNLDSLLNVSNWKVTDSDGNVFTFPLFLSYPEQIFQSTFLLHSGKGDYNLNSVYWNSDQEIWENTGDTLYLYDHNGDLILEQSY